MAYNPFDDVIENDPAYMQTGGETYRQSNAPGGLRPQEALTKKGGPVIEKLREQFPNFDNLQDEYLDKSAQSLSEVVSPIYNFLGMGTDKYNEAKQLDKAILQNQQIQFEEKPKPGSLEEGRMIKESAPAYMDFLKEQGYTGNTNILRELQNFVVVPQMKVFNKLAKGEALYSELSADEKMLTDPLLVGLDMIDLAGLTALATKGFRQPFINFVTNAKRNNVPIQKIIEDTSKLFPEDTQKAATFFFGEQKRVNFKPLTEDGTGSGSNKLNRGSPESYDLRFHSPWMQEAEKIMKNSKGPMTSNEISSDLKELGFNVEAQNIKNWVSKGTNVKDKSIVSKFKDVNFDDMIRDQKVQAIKDLVADLKANPEKQGKGFINYTYTIPYKNQTKDVKDITARKKNRPNFVKELGDDLYNELVSLTIKKNEGKTYKLYTSYFDQSNKRIYQSPILEKRNRAQDAVFQAFRDGTFGKNANFIEVMDSIGMQKIEGLTGSAKKEILQQNEEKLVQVNEYLKTFKDPKDIQMYNKVFDDSVQLTEYALPKWRETVMNSPELQEILIREFQKFDPEATNLNSIISRVGKNFSGHVSHIAQLANFAGPQKDFVKGLRGLGGVGNMVRVNYGVENLPLQRTSENVIKKGVARINVLNKKNNLNEKEQDELFNIISNISYYNNLLKKKGMAAYIRMDKNVLTDEIINQINNYTKARGGPNGSPSNQIIAGNIKNVDDKGNQIKDNISSTYNDIFIGSEKPFSLEQQKARFDDLMKFYTENPKEFSISMKPPEYTETFVEGVEETPFAQKGFPNIGKKRIEEETLFKKGGPVKMALGGDPLENINQQQFASDPATDDNFFQQAVQDENLLAFNPANLFKIFKKSSAVATPNKVVGGVPDAPTNMLPATAKVDIDDFPFKSHFIDTLSEQNIPNIDSPQGWRNLFSGTKGFAKSELEGAGIMGYLEDAEKFMPGMKITKQNLLDVYEKSPIANLEIKVKTEVPMPGEYKNYVGSAKHKNMGNAPIDEGGTDYRNIVINVKEIPGQDKPFFNPVHFDKDPNVLAFTRVANYKNATGDDVAVIQELQTDLITNLRKEQERVKATASAVRNKKELLQQNLINYPNDEYTKGELDRLNAQYPEEKLKFLETTDLTRPADPIFLEQLAPELTTQLNAIQDQINNILAQNRGRIVNPNYLEQIKQLQDQGLVVFNRLFDLNRQKNFDDMLQGAKVTDAYQSPQILDIGAGNNVPTDRDVQSFGQIPFGKGPDWIDLMLKATIQDAQSRGINKVAIMPADIINQRWNKDIDGAEAEKFKSIYDKISVQELKNIAKKYTGNKANLQIEEIVDPNKPQQAFQILNKNVDGTFAKRDRDIEPSMPVGSNIGPDDTADFNYQIYNVASDFDYGDVVVRKEIAPGQVMDYYVKIVKAKEPKIDPESGIDMSIARQDTIEFVPLKENQIAEDSKVIIEEYNPSLQKMYVLTMPEETTKKGPMFLFRKKDGGKIKSDGLVSITDIYGDY